MTYSVDVENLLLGLAWMGEASTPQIQRLWMPRYSYSTVGKYLKQLHRDGLVTCRRWALPQAKRGGGP